jgi:hypothetical protein
MIIPVDIWGPVTNALNQFFTSPAAAGIGVGIQFFSGGCNAAAYATPAVPVAELPGNAQALASMLAMRLPGPGTATTPALEGAIMHARSRAMENPGVKTVVLLVTDGEPASCGSTIASTAAAAAAGFSGTPSIPTYVLGLGNVGGLHEMAQGGGTGNAFVVSDPGSVQAVVDAMNAIRSQALPCEYSIPQSTGAFDKNLVNLRWDNGGQASLVPFVQSASGCAAATGGWFYDDDDAPSRLIACEATCSGLKSGGRVEVVLGCPQVGPD